MTSASRADSILVVETEVRKGPALAMRRMDVASVLPSSLGVEEINFDTNPALLSAATNMFVGATRPRHLLALALRKEAVSDELIEAAKRKVGFCTKPLHLEGRGRAPF